MFVDSKSIEFWNRKTYDKATASSHWKLFFLSSTHISQNPSQSFTTLNTKYFVYLCIYMSNEQNNPLKYITEFCEKDHDWKQKQY